MHQNGPFWSCEYQNPIWNKVILTKMVVLTIMVQNAFRQYCGDSLVNGRGCLGGQSARGHPKAFPRLGLPLFAVPALRELESACRVSVFLRCCDSPTVCFSGLCEGPQLGSATVCDPNPPRPFARYRIKMKLELPPPPKKTQHPPPSPKMRILWAWGYFQQKDPKEIPGAHEIGAAMSGPRIAGQKITDMRFFLS